MRRRESEVRRLSDPTVCAVLLTADRPEYARRAVECFRRQTYQRKFLLVWDSGKTAAGIEAADNELWVRETPCADRTIGTLRNSAIHAAFSRADDKDVVVHFDDDDYSHPNRIAEQVAFLQSSGADVVGFREMLFWREARCPDCGEPMKAEAGYYGTSCDHQSEIRPEAWLYSNPDPRYCLGTSLCYWRKTWERKPFEATSQGEDIRFCTGLDCVGVSSLIAPNGIAFTEPMKPRMIARIHSGNTSTAYRPELMAAIERQGGEWKRSPEWDSYCRGVME